MWCVVCCVFCFVCLLVLGICLVFACAFRRLAVCVRFAVCFFLPVVLLVCFCFCLLWFPSSVVLLVVELVVVSLVRFACGCALGFAAWL